MGTRVVSVKRTDNMLFQAKSTPIFTLMASRDFMMAGDLMGG
jgi:hypothetical protein